MQGVRKGEVLTRRRDRIAHTRNRELPFLDRVTVEEVGCISLVRSVS